MKESRGWALFEVADQLLADLPRGSHVNLGIGLPTLLIDRITDEHEVLLQSENGILGIAGRPSVGEEDPDLVDSAKQPIALRSGATVFDSVLSFAMLRGGHVDVAVLGAHQVSTSGDLANWRIPTDIVGGIGGAADICRGVKEVWVMMRLLTRSGASKLRQDCSFPVTARGVVTRLYTDLGVFVRERVGFHVIRLPPGIQREALNDAGVPLAPASQMNPAADDGM